MRKVAAIALLSLRLAIRSRLVVSLMAILLLCIVGIPLTVRGDGTLQGEIRVLLTYSLGLAWILLSMTTLWAGCAAISSDIRDRQIQCVLSAPVSRAQVWLGKWVALVILNAALLALSGATVWGMLEIRLRHGGWKAEEVAAARADALRAHHVVLPETPDVSAPVRAEWERLVKAGEVTASERSARERDLRNQALARARSAAAGSSVTWTFALPQPLQTGTLVRLRYHLTDSQGGGRELAGSWFAGTPRDPRLAQTRRFEAAGALRTLDLPADRLAGAEVITLTYQNEDDQGAAVFFDPTEGVRLLIPAGAFLPNLARALFTLLAPLSFLAALGVSAGAIFSLPVASVVSLFALVMQQSSRFIGSVVGGDRYWEPDDPSPVVAALLAIVRGVLWLLNLLLEPLRFANPLDALSLGHRIDGSQMLSVWLVNGLAYGGIAAVAGLLLFRRREVGLPD